MQKHGVNFALTDDLEISTSFPSNQERQAVQTQQEDSQNPTSALLSALPNGYSASSHVTQQVLNRTPYGERKDKTAVDTQTSVDKCVGHSMVSPLSSYDINPTVSPAVTFRLAA